MSKILHVFVYVFLALAVGGLYFESQLNAKRKTLTDRNRLQEDYIVRIASTIENAEPNKDVVAKLEVDSSPVEAKIIDTPDTENVLEDYKQYLEQDNLATYSWENQAIREQLRTVYVLDAEGNPVMDGDRPLMKGQGTEDELLAKLLASCQTQQEKLNNTRAELKSLRERFDPLVAELNKLKPEARQDKVTIEQKNKKIETLEGEKSELEKQIVKVKSQIDDLNSEITSLKDEVTTAQEEANAAKDDLATALENNKRLNNMLKEALVAAGGTRGGGNTVNTLPTGDKGRIVSADNENMYAIVEFTPEAMKELKGKDANAPLPVMEVAVRRPGYVGEAGEFVGRLRLRQEVPGKNYVICDILANWEQDKLKEGDVVFAD
ncbi:MAG: hypothetical protein J6W80_03855 [Kiritimatiellae bacterium]|nr:hypothetical protein [Kiritimatiellia bacterium]